MNIDPNSRAAAVFTYKSIARIAQDGGTQSWRMDAKHIGTFNWVICARCRTEFDAEDDRLHKTAFLLGKVLDVVPSTEPHNDPTRGGNRRWLFRLSEVAVLDIPEFWKFGRWPVSIDTLDAFGINPADYTFRPLSEFLDDAAEAAITQENARRHDELAIRARRTVSEIIAEHKASISEEIGVPEDRIEISVRF